MTSTSTDLVLGPLLRYVDETSASVWVETRERARVTVTRGARVLVGRHLRGPRAPLRAGRAGRPRAGVPRAVHRRRRRPARVAAGGVDAPGAGDRHPGAGQAAADGLRLLPHLRGARQGRQRDPRRRRAARLRAADGRPGRGARPRRRPGPARAAVARPRPLPRRPGLRRRDDRRDARVHQRPPRHREAAVDRAEGLPGVRPPLLAGVDRRRPTAGCSRRCRRR